MSTVKVDSFDLHRMVLLLDASLDALDRAAAAEKRREAGKPMRETTEQGRAATVREFVAEMSGKYSIDLDW